MRARAPVGWRELQPYPAHFYSIQSYPSAVIYEKYILNAEYAAPVRQTLFLKS